MQPPTAAVTTAVNRGGRNTVEAHIKMEIQSSKAQQCGFAWKVMGGRWSCGGVAWGANVTDWDLPIAHHSFAKH